MNPRILAYPLKSHRKLIFLPEDSEKLAELLGIIFGDGGIGNEWQLVISLNSIADLEYSKYVVALIESLFNLKVSVRKRPNQNTLILVCSSMNLLDYLVVKGVVRGNKLKQNFDIPHWINRDLEFKKAFVKGLVDTDGCLYIHKHKIKEKYYANLGFCFTSFSSKLLDSVANILRESGIKPYITNKNRCIYLYSYSAVIKYLNIFGSSNPRIWNKYYQWRGRIVA